VAPGNILTAQFPAPLRPPNTQAKSATYVGTRRAPVGKGTIAGLEVSISDRRDALRRLWRPLWRHRQSNAGQRTYEQQGAQHQAKHSFLHLVYLHLVPSSTDEE
jgi:hypothetical protein